MSSETRALESLFQKLIGFDTTSRNSNLACINFIRGYLEGFGVKSELVSNEDSKKACLWATVGNAQNSGITLAGHTDTVPVDDQNWLSDPFMLTERDGKFFGRGTADMKGFIACALSFVPEFLQNKTKTCFNLAFTYDEEISMAGALKLTEFLKQKEIKPAWVWIGEPTGLAIVDEHKGVSAYKTDFAGVAGHSGQPQHGLNAIALANAYMSVIADLAKEHASDPYAPSRFTPPYTVFNLGTIKGGTAENIIAGSCELLWQMRAYPGENAATIAQEVERRAEKILSQAIKPFASQASFKTCTCFDIPPFWGGLQNKGSHMLKHFLKCDQTHAVGFGTEAGIFQQIGTDAVVCGPGFIEQAHQPNEYIDKSQLVACVDLVRAVLLSSSAPDTGSTAR